MVRPRSQLAAHRQPSRRAHSPPPPQSRPPNWAAWRPLRPLRRERPRALSAKSPPPLLTQRPDRSTPPLERPPRRPPPAAWPARWRQARLIWTPAPRPALWPECLSPPRFARPFAQKPPGRSSRKLRPTTWSRQKFSICSCSLSNHDCLHTQARLKNVNPFPACFYHAARHGVTQKLSTPLARLAPDSTRAELDPRGQKRYTKERLGL